VACAFNNRQRLEFQLREQRIPQEVIPCLPCRKSVATARLFQRQRRYRWRPPTPHASSNVVQARISGAIDPGRAPRDASPQPQQDRKTKTNRAAASKPPLEAGADVRGWCEEYFHFQSEK
jgi:hypothetical protein